MERQQQSSLDHKTQPASTNNHRLMRDPITAVSPQFPSTSSVRYRECLKNHAAKMGSHVTDGCGEFMASGEEGRGPDYFKCAACGCHRNFHRKETDGVGNRYLDPGRATAADSIFSPLSASAHPTVIMTFGGGAESSSEDRDLMFRTDAGDQGLVSGAHRKRFRTKFTSEQKEEMAEFAEKIGWRLQREDEQELLQFCSKIGVKRQVFKVWMHNNKLAMKKKKNDQQQ